MRYETFCSALLCSALVQNAHAYKCETPSVQKAYQEADIVFAGTIKNLTTQKISGTRQVLEQTTLRPIERDFNFFKTEMVFDIIKIWKGDIDQNDIFYIHDDIKDIPYNKLRTYLIYAKREANNFVVRPCSPYEELGPENGYIKTIILDQINTHPTINHDLHQLSN